MLTLLQLPKNTLFTIIGNLNFPDIVRFCHTSKISNSICSNSEFWIHKFINEFNKPYLNTTEFEPMTEFVLQKRELERQRLGDLEAEFLSSMHKTYQNAALECQKDQMEQAFKQTFLIESTHEFHELDILITDFASSGYDDEDSYKGRMEESVNEVLGNIQTILDNNSVTIIKLSGIETTTDLLILNIYARLLEYRRNQEVIYRDIRVFNQLLMNLLGETYFLTINKFENKPPPPNLGPFPIDVPLPPPLKAVVVVGEDDD